MPYRTAHLAPLMALWLTAFMSLPALAASTRIVCNANL
jgi:hypothetical protein